MGQYDTTSDAPLGDESFREITTSEGTLRLVDITAKELCLSEHLLIWRRRHGLTQPEAASFLAMSVRSYKAVERQDTKCRLTEMPALGEIETYEICFLLRRRSGWTIPMCAEHAGISRYWYNLMEQGKVNPETLVRYWAE